MGVFEDAIIGGFFSIIKSVLMIIYTTILNLCLGVFGFVGQLAVRTPRPEIVGNWNSLMSGPSDGIWSVIHDTQEAFMGAGLGLIILFFFMVQTFEIWEDFSSQSLSRMSKSSLFAHGVYIAFAWPITVIILGFADGLSLAFLNMGYTGSGDPSSGNVFRPTFDFIERQAESEMGVGGVFILILYTLLVAIASLILSLLWVVNYFLIHILSAVVPVMFALKPIKLPGLKVLGKMGDQAWKFYLSMVFLSVPGAILAGFTKLIVEELLGDGNEFSGGLDGNVSDVNASAPTSNVIENSKGEILSVSQDTDLLSSPHIEHGDVLYESSFIVREAGSTQLAFSLGDSYVGAVIMLLVATSIPLIAVTGPWLLAKTVSGYNPTIPTAVGGAKKAYAGAKKAKKKKEEADELRRRYRGETKAYNEETGEHEVVDQDELSENDNLKQSTELTGKMSTAEDALQATDTAVKTAYKKKEALKDDPAKFVGKSRPAKAIGTKGKGALGALKGAGGKGKKGISFATGKELVENEDSSFGYSIEDHNNRYGMAKNAINSAGSSIKETGKMGAKQFAKPAKALGNHRAIEEASNEMEQFEDGGELVDVNDIDSQSEAEDFLENKAAKQELGLGVYDDYEDAKDVSSKEDVERDLRQEIEEGEEEITDFDSTGLGRMVNEESDDDLKRLLNAVDQDETNDIEDSRKWLEEYQENNFENGQASSLNDVEKLTSAIDEKLSDRKSKEFSDEKENFVESAKDTVVEDASSIAENEAKIMRDGSSAVRREYAKNNEEYVNTREEMKSTGRSIEGVKSSTSDVDTVGVGFKEEKEAVAEETEKAVAGGEEVEESMLESLLGEEMFNNLDDDLLEEIAESVGNAVSNETMEFTARGPDVDTDKMDGVIRKTLENELEKAGLSDEIDDFSDTMSDLNPSEFVDKGRVTENMATKLGELFEPDEDKVEEQVDQMFSGLDEEAKEEVVEEVSNSLGEATDLDNDKLQEEAEKIVRAGMSFEEGGSVGFESANVESIIRDELGDSIDDNLEMSEILDDDQIGNKIASELGENVDEALGEFNDKVEDNLSEVNSTLENNISDVADEFGTDRTEVRDIMNEVSDEISEITNETQQDVREDGDRDMAEMVRDLQGRSMNRYIKRIAEEFQGRGVASMDSTDEVQRKVNRIYKETKRSEKGETTEDDLDLSLREEDDYDDSMF